jgi:hypothetical protein
VTDNASDKTDELEQRIAILLMSIQGWQRNYTASLDAARWLIAEAERVGWIVLIGEPT